MDENINNENINMKLPLLLTIQMTYLEYLCKDSQ